MTDLVCPECGFAAKASQGLGAHRRSKHGVHAPPAAEQQRAYYRAYYEANKDQIAEWQRERNRRRRVELEALRAENAALKAQLEAT